MNERLTPQREAEIAAAVAELDADRSLSFGTWTASPVTEKTTLPPEQAFAVEDVARLGNATIRGSVGVFGDERHAAFTALARDAVPALLAELAAVRAERNSARAALRDATEQIARLEAEYGEAMARVAELERPAVDLKPTVVAMYLATPCDTCNHTLNWHRNDVGCTVGDCVCGRFVEPTEQAVS
ncbi:hypothetical protein AB0K88_31095 [Streptomyces werraensis]|uniref:hypothetical protein n=1 Tax=Streptomyces werraensis TaxID=68284 RepID=UPI00343E315E